MSGRRRCVYMMDILATVPYYTAYLSRALLAQGVDVRVGSITYYLDLACFRSRGLKLSPGCMDVVGHFPKLPRPARRIAKLLETTLNLFALSVRFLLRPPEILHVQYLPMLRSRLPLDVWFMRIVRWRGARVVLTVHDLMPHDTADRHRETFRKLYAEVDQLICHSSAIQARLQGEFAVSSQRIHVVPHGPFFYDLPSSDDGAVRSHYGIAPEQQIVLWQGIIFPYKGLDLLVDAWQTVEERCSNAILLVAGIGSEEILAGVRAQVQRLTLKRVVLDLRFSSAEDLVALYRAAAMVVYPYRAITTSGALATGVSLGKAIVASDLPVFRELLTDEVDALLIPPGDVSALSSAVSRLLEDPALQTRLAGAVRAKEFGAASWKGIAIATEAVYEEALHAAK